MNKRQRETYASSQGQYELDPAHLMEIVSSLSFYTRYAPNRAVRDNPTYNIPMVSLIGHGRKLVVSTEALDNEGDIQQIELAELVLSTEKDCLTMRVNAHQQVTIPSDDLHYIGKEYKR